MSGPLDGYKVIEITSTVSGPIVGMILGDQGADIIKVEPPLIGDPARFMGDSRNGMPAMYATLNRNKRSLVLDFKEAADLAIFKRLVEDADVLIENYRPGVVTKLGIDYESLSAINPGLVYASIFGYDQSGPYARRRVYDPLIQATAGTALAEHPHRPYNLRTVIFDKVTGYTASQAITAALLQRTRTGVGQYLPVSMLQSALYFQWPDVMWSRTLQGDGATDAGELADYFQLYQARDGHVAIILVADEDFAAVCELVGTSLHEEPRFLSFADRIANRELLIDALSQALAEWPCAELCEKLDSLNIPAARANTLDDVFDDPQIRHQNSIISVEHPLAGEMRIADTPFHFDGQPPLAQNPAASHGQHSTEILTELGVDQQDIDRIEKREAENRTLIAGFNLLK